MSARAAHRLRAQAKFSQDGSAAGLFLVGDGVAGGGWLGGQRGDLWRLLSPALRLQDRNDVTRRRARARMLEVPSAQSPYNLLMRPVLKLVAPPRQLTGADFLGLARLEIGAENDQDFIANSGSVIAELLRRKRRGVQRRRTGKR